VDATPNKGERCSERRYAEQSDITTEQNFFEKEKKLHEMGFQRILKVLMDL